MKLTAKQRGQFTILAMEAALQKFRREHPRASENAAWRYAVQNWRNEEFIWCAAEIIAIWHVIDESAAAPFN